MGKRLHPQLLHAALKGDNEQILRVAEELQLSPFLGAVEHTTDEDESGDEDGDRADSSSSASQCTVCAEEPKHVEVWNVSCGHGFCGDCMLARLSGRDRKCLHCRAKVLQVVDASGRVFQHYVWTRWWRDQRQVGGVSRNGVM